MVGADVLGGPRPPGRPRARGMDVPCARRAEDVAPYQPAHPGPPPGRHGRMAVTGTFVVGADVPGGPRPRNVPVRAACTSPCARRAEDVAPYQPAHPVPLCRETLCPPPWALWPQADGGKMCYTIQSPRD